MCLQASLLPPALDYTEVGDMDAHSKFSVSPDGRVTSANSSIRTGRSRGSVPLPSPASGARLLFDPRQFVPYWPETNWSDFKSAMVGRVSRAVRGPGLQFGTPAAVATR